MLEDEIKESPYELLTQNSMGSTLSFPWVGAGLTPINRVRETDTDNLKTVHCLQILPTVTSVSTNN